MATTSATDRDVDGAPAMFLAFKIGKGQKTTTRDNIVVIRPIYTALKVSRINVTQDQDHIDVILKAIPACKARVAEDAKPTDNAKLTDNPDPPKSR